MINLDLLKLSNLLQGQAPSPTFPTDNPMIGNPDIFGAQTPQIQGPNQPDLMNQLGQMLNPQDTQFNTLIDLLKGMPRRDQYEPTGFRKVTAALAGLGSNQPSAYSGGAALGFKSNVPEQMKIQEAIRDEPYNKALNDWMNQLGPQEKIAAMESQRNTNLRQTALGAIQRQNELRKIEETERKNKEDEDRKREELANRERRTDAYVQSKAFQEKHPQYKSVVDKNGKLWLYNSIDPTEKPVDTGLEKLSDMEKIDFQVQGRLEEIQARSRAAQELEGTKSTNRTSLENQRQENRSALESQKQTGRETIQTNKTTAKGVTPGQLNIQRKVDAQDLKIQHPDWSKYITIDKGNVSVLTPQDKGGPDPVVYRQIVDALKLNTDKDIPLGSIQIKPEQFNRDLTRPPAQSTPSRNLTRAPITLYESDALKAARKDLKSGNVIVTHDGGITFKQMPAENANDPRFPSSGYVVVK